MQLFLFIAAIVVLLVATFIGSVRWFNLQSFGLALLAAALAWPVLAAAH